MNIADLIIYIIVGIAFLVGLFKGLAKQSWATIFLVGIFALCIFLEPIIYNYISANFEFESAITDYFNSIILQNPVMTNDLMAKYTVCLGIDVVLAIVGILIGLLIKFIYKVLTKNLFFKIIDRILGGAYKACLIAIVLYIVGGLMYVLAGYDYMAVINEQDVSSVVFRYFYSQNLLGSVFNQFFIEIILGVTLGFVTVSAYKKGFLHKADWLINLGVVVLMAYLAFTLVTVEPHSMFVQLITFFTEKINALVIMVPALAGFLTTDVINITSTYIVVGVVAIVLIILGIIVLKIILGILNSLRKRKIFFFIDGFIGVIWSTVFMTAVLMVLGSVLYSFKDFEFMNVLNDLLSTSAVGNYLYAQNPLNQFIGPILQTFISWGVA